MSRPSTSLALTCLASPLLAVICGCNMEEMQKKHEQNVQKWNAMWSRDGSGGSLFGPKVGDSEIWTIECNEYLGPKSREMADSVAAALKKVDGAKGEAVRVEHGEDRSRVLYGSYPLKYVQAKSNNKDQVEGDTVIELSEEIKRDLKFIRSLAMGESFPFFSARPIPQPVADVGPPEWDLRNARGVYTLNVGVTFNTAAFHNHKEAAVEWVRALREDGFQAYYYHSPDGTKTSICVGTFGDDALIMGPDGKTQYSEAVQAVRNQGDFQYNLENGQRIYRKAINPETGQMERMPNWSFLVKIPPKEKTAQ